jgi:hypothetical protein
MKLGVDISALNVVYMRNIPLTPANHACVQGVVNDQTKDADAVLPDRGDQGDQDNQQ